MRLGIFAKTFPGKDPDTVLAAVRAAGFEAAQYNMACSGLPSMPDALTEAEVGAVSAAATRHGVAIAAVSGTYNMAHPDPAVRDTGLRRLDLLLRNAGGMGTELVTLCTGTRDPDDQWRHHPDNHLPESWAVMRAEMAKAAALAEQHGVALGIEPELGNIVSSAQKARQLIDELQSPSLRIVLDPANLFEIVTLPEQHLLLAEAVDLLADRIIMAHAKDRKADGSFAAAGQGVVDFPFLISRLRTAGFTGDLVTHGLEAHEAPGVAKFLKALVA